MCVYLHMYWFTHVYIYIYVYICPYIHIRSTSACNVTHMNRSCHTYGYTMWNMRIRHVAHMNEPCHTYENPCRTSKWIMFHIMYIAYEYKTSRMRIRHVTHMNEPCHTYEESMSHTQMNHVTHYIYCQCIYSNMHVGAYIRAESCSWVMPHVSKSTTAHM